MGAITQEEYDAAIAEVDAGFKFENGVKHVIDDYTSKSNPEKSYINDFVYDLKGNLQKIITLKNKTF